MTDLRAQKRERWRATVALVGCGLIYGLAGLLPDRRLWGFNHLAFLPTMAWVLFGVFLIAVIAVVWLLPDSKAGTQRGPRVPGGILLAGILAGWIILTWVARASTQLLGDGYLRIDEIERLKPGTYGIQEFLPGLLAALLHQNALSGWSVSGRDALAIVGVFSGALLLFGAFLLWPRVIGGDSNERGSCARLSALWILAGGSSALFFGYAESYALSWALLSLFTLTLLAHRHGRLGWGWPVALWAVAVWSHLAALAWAPALIWEAGRADVPGRRRYLPVGVSVCVVVAVTLALWYLKPNRDQLGFGNHLLALWGARYSVIDWRHLADILNELVLLAPIGFLLLWPEDKRDGGRVAMADILLIAPTVAAFLLFNPELSFPRDWDLFALFSAPVVTFLAVLIARRQWSWSRPRRLATLAVGAATLGLWVWVNASAGASVTRFSNLLELDPRSRKAGTGREVLARYWREMGRWDLAADELGRALALGPHARLSIQRGIALSTIGQTDSALASFQAAIAADSTDPDGYFGAGQTLWVMGQANESLPYLERAVAMDSTRPDYRYHLGMTLRDLKQPRLALPHLQFAMSYNPAQPDYAIACGITLYDLGDYDGAIGILNATLQRFPNYNLAYLDLGWVYFKMGRYEQASAALATYEQRQSLGDQDANPRRLRYLLDSVAIAAQGSGK
ncbi:MAG: tetratricopeptide repeat protein [candidate division Zixibacteria bacterium]|nr:tetratricopeptide repeat protein [candidate division Zixibacteria bacterium]